MALRTEPYNKDKVEACKLLNIGIHSEDKYPNNRDKTRKSREQLGNDTFTLYPLFTSSSVGVYCGTQVDFLDKKVGPFIETLWSSTLL